jgi:ketosteroid isomerase-like protein
MLPPSGRTAATEAAKPLQPAAALAPAPKKPTSRLLIAAVAVAVVALFGLTALGGAGWWYFRQRGARGAEPSRTVGTTTPASDSTPPLVTTPPAPAKAEASSPAAPAAGPPAVDAPPAAPTQAGTLPAPGGVPAPGQVPIQTGPPAAQAAAPAQPPSQPPAATIASPTQPAASAPLPVADAATKPSAAVRPPGAAVESGVAASSAARPGVNQNTVDLLAGRQAGQGYDASTATSAQAAVSRINYVLEQYVKALVAADAEAIREFRPSLSPGESALMRARQLKVRLDDVRVEVNGAEATARCRRRIDGISESGAPLQEDGVAIYRLVRKASGWVIADVR